MRDWNVKQQMHLNVMNGKAIKFRMHITSNVSTIWRLQVTLLGGLLVYVVVMSSFTKKSQEMKKSSQQLLIRLENFGIWLNSELCRR